MKSLALSALLVISVCFTFIRAETEQIPTFARIDSCPSCSLNRLPEVKKFIYDDVPQYENVVFNKIQGAKPELVLLDANKEEMERIPLSKLNRQECNELLEKYGFHKKEDAKTENSKSEL